MVKPAAKMRLEVYVFREIIVLCSVSFMNYVDIIRATREQQSCL